MHIKGSELTSEGHLDNGNFTLENQNDSSWTTSLETVNHNNSYPEDSNNTIICEDIKFKLQKIDDDSTQIDEELNLETIRGCIRSLEPSLVGRTSPVTCDYSTDEGLFEYEDGEKSSSTEDSQQPDDEAIFDETDTDESYHEQLPRGIYNPNYPGFQHFAYTLQGFCAESPHDEFNNNEDDPDKCANLEQDSTPVNTANPEPTDDFQCDLVTLQREIYEVIHKPMSDSLSSMDEGIDGVMKYMESFTEEVISPKELEAMVEVKDIETKATDAYMSDARESIRPENNSELKKTPGDLNCNKMSFDEIDNKQTEEKSVEFEKTEHKQKCTKKEKETPQRAKQETKSIKKGEKLTGFDVYNIETAMPSIDMEAIENHLRAAREEERKRRNDREEIRRRLAMGTDYDDYYQANARPGRKPSLQSRLQSGMNLQICFMNETASDNESPSESENNEVNDNISNKKSIENQSDRKNKADKIFNNNTSSFKVTKVGITRPTSLPLKDTSKPTHFKITSKADFFECQARLQAEARMALAQAKEIARIQMEIERQNMEISPITEMLRYSLQKAGVDLLGDRRRVSRQILTDMNVTQLQVIVNELHTQIEHLNEDLVQLLITRDELHMSQDSMLVDIEDLTRYLSAREVNTKSKDFEDKPHADSCNKNNNTQLTAFSAFTTLLQK